MVCVSALCFGVLGRVGCGEICLVVCELLLARVMCIEDACVEVFEVNEECVV